MAPIKTPTVILILTTDLEVVMKQIFQIFFPESNPGLVVCHPLLIFLCSNRDRLNKTTRCN